ncbi:MAG TPA: FG-GAP repeat protein [Dokdonella sp.]|uniref:FG-GAP repeat protein n=1 Tax=Dokdonella sp. TaxID=2291710 RepID=UPI002C43DF0A|nr:FG-GAP repeat protein [Dokdonella sp.]HUD41050.1 FG-GAP repeat protein [Dokdonella sp.]
MSIATILSAVRLRRSGAWLAVALFAAPVSAADQVGSYRNLLLRNPYVDAAGAGFGRGIVGGDFDGDGIDDLAIAESGSTRLRVALGTPWTLSTTQPVIPFLPSTITTPFQSGVFARGDFDGDGRDEIAVGHPFVNVGGSAGAGTVYVLDRAVNGTWSVQLTIRAGGTFPGSPVAQAHLGNALASGDFDDDGYDDLAIGLRGQVVAGQDGAGAVMVIYGTPAGLAAPGARLFDRSNDGLTFAPREDDRYGWAVAAGDFDDDGYDELAVGVPNATCPNGSDRGGGVVVLAGSAAGVVTSATRIWRPGVLGVLGDCATAGGFGNALTASEFDSLTGTPDDLAIGAPTTAGGGAVHVIYGSASGLDAERNQRMTPPVRPGIDSSDARFGNVLLSARLAYDCVFIVCMARSLAIGAPFTDVDGVDAAGVVWLVMPRLGESSLDPSTIRPILPKPPLRIAGPVPNTQFGSALASGDFNDDSRVDLAIGAYLYDEADATDAGAVQVLYQSDYLFVDPFE